MSALRLKADAEWWPIAEQLNTIAEPILHNDDLFSVLAPDPDNVPTQDDLDAATAALISLQDDLNTIPPILGQIDGIVQAMSEAYQEGDSYPPFSRALARGRELRDLWLEYQTLRIQQMTTFVAAVAKLEHDLQWQAYVSDNFGTNPADIPRKATRPRLLIKGLNS